jgi:hypothetical protein
MPLLDKPLASKGTRRGHCNEVGRSFCAVAEMTIGYRARRKHNVFGDTCVR